MKIKLESKRIYKIGVFGSAVGEAEDIIKKAQAIGQELGKRQLIIITGACSGLPNMAAQAAAEHGSRVWGFSPAKNQVGQKNFAPFVDVSLFQKIEYIPDNFKFKDNSDICKKYRNVISVANCDAGIIIAGSWGTLNEFTTLIDYGKVIGVLIKSGGTADEIKRLTKKLRKKKETRLCFSSSPQKLVSAIIKELDRQFNN